MTAKGMGGGEKSGELAQQMPDRTHVCGNLLTMHGKNPPSPCYNLGARHRFCLPPVTPDNTLLTHAR
jgi:hypothetical protein